MKFTAPSNKRPTLAALAVTGLCLAATYAVFASEPTESGWTVARPNTVLETKHADNAQIRIAINHILEQSQTPLLLTPARQPAIEAAPEVVKEPATDEAAKASGISDEGGPQIIFGNYGTSADGWRPAHLPSDQQRTEPSSSEPRHEGTSITPSRPRFRPVASSSSSAATDQSETTDSENIEPSDTTPVDAPTIQADERPIAKPAAAKPEIDAKTFSTESNVEPNREQPVGDSDDSTEAKSPVVEKPAEPLPPLSQNMKNLRAKVRRVIKSYYTRPLNSRDNDPWELMHGMLAYGVHSKIRQGSPRGETITLVGWLCYNRPSKGMTLLYLTPENELRAKQGVGLQGHMGQFLAMLAQCQVAPDYPIRVRGAEFTINDLIEAEKETCYPKSELTFKLIALMHYLDSDASWVNDQGQSWDIPRLIREEMAQPIRGAACGGTHRLSGLSLAARTRVRRGEPLDGDYLRAAQFVEKYQNYAFQLQNRDGSLSTEWFRGRGEEDDTDRRVKTTGHILEWLCYSLPDKDVRSARTFRAANYLSSLLASNFNHEWEVGPLSHAIHALRLYDERVFQPYDGQEDVAKKPVRKTARRPMPTAESRSHTMGF